MTQQETFTARQLHPYEEVFKDFKMTMFGRLSISLDLDSKVLQKALEISVDWICEKHPYLRLCVIDSEWKRSDKIPITFEIVDEVIDDAFILQQMNLQLKTKIDFTKSVLHVTATLGCNQQLSLGIVLCHGGADGRSTLFVYEDLLEFFACHLSPVPTQDKPASFPLRDMLSLLSNYDVFAPLLNPVEWTEDKTPSGRKLLPKPAAEGPVLEAAGDTGCFQAVSRRLSKEEFAPLKAKLEFHLKGSFQPVMTFAALIATILRVVKSMDELETYEAIGMVAVQLRRHCRADPSPVEDNELLVGGTCFWLNFPLTRSDNIWDLIKGAKKSMKQQLDSSIPLEFMSRVCQGIPGVPFTFFASNLGTHMFDSISYPKSSQQPTMKCSRQMFSGGSNGPFSDIGIYCHSFFVDSGLEISLSICRPAYTDLFATKFLEDMFKVLSILSSEKSENLNIEALVTSFF